jgi:hypothetical protein
MVELDSTSTFEDFRVATLAICADLGFGLFTTCGSVHNAWAKVSLGSIYVSSPSQYNPKLRLSFWKLTNTIGSCNVACADLSLNLYMDYWAPDDMVNSC